MRRDGRFLEVVGTYDPLKANDKAVFKQERVLDWLQKGAQPTNPVRAPDLTSLGEALQVS